MKEYFTIEEQIIHLKEKGLLFDDEIRAKEILLKENYYNVINGYKDLFIDKNKTDERFRTNVKFEEIYSLYVFDREIRNIFLSYILIIENNLKSVIAHEFSKNYGVDNYLRISNFDDFSEDKLIPESRRQQQIGYIQDLISNIQKDIAQSISKKEYISHYIVNHGYIPLWVLINALSLGRISKYYSLMKQKNRIQIAKHWGVKENDLTQYIKMLAFYRNLCAHDERLYNAKTGKTCSIPDTKYHKKINIPKVNGRYAYGKNDLFALFITLKVLLNEKDFNTLFNKIHGRVYSINSKIEYITLKNIYEKMGFPDNWYNIRKS